ncbi:uncharacterized protein LODBEIA_P16680 [Lodderomyces beijingensis]|uniref:Methyltransferase domain-containing protein n=1 Tax=Lodderomyces beijingensis TaxID=1775926 RepID=A0ABP0ZHT6_9ASCO
MVNEQAYYAGGFKKSVSDTHTWRNVDNSAKFVTNVLQPSFQVLDVGCGPGTITIDFAQNYLNEQGFITGVEPTRELIEIAKSNKDEIAPKCTNIKFEIASIYELPYDDDTFDLVHAHQVVVHLQDPVAALAELKRVTKPGGYVCVKDADLETIIVTPSKYEVLRQYSLMTAQNAVSTDTKGGRTLREKAIKAGYEPSDIATSRSHWLLCDDFDAKRQWVDLMTKRQRCSGEKIYADDEAKNEAAKSDSIAKWQEWGNDPTSIFDVSSFEITYRKP